MKKLLLLLFSFTFTFGFAQNWGEQQISHPNPGNNYSLGDSFGFAVSIEGNYAAISAPGKNIGTGVVHMYKKNVNGAWNHLQTIEEHTGQAGDNYFGHSIKINGDYLFVGSPLHRINEAAYQGPAGAVLVYKKDANDHWVATQILRSSDITHSDRFGISIASSNDYLLIGAHFEDHNENGNNQMNLAGAAYLFKKDVNGNWNEVQKIVSSHRKNNNRFGKTLAIYGDYLIVGSASFTDENNQNSSGGDGSVFVFKKDANGVWNETQKLKASNPDISSNFGMRGLTISDEYIAVGSQYQDYSSSNSNYGAIYMFKKDANGIWGQTQILSPQYSSSLFGYSLDIDDDLLVASDPEYSTRDANGGYIDANIGAIRVFVKDNNDAWVHVNALTMANSEVNLKATGAFDHGGSVHEEGYNVVGISNNTFVFGVPEKDIIIGGASRNRIGEAYFSGDIDALGLLSASLRVEKNEFLTSIQGFPNPLKTNFYIKLASSHANIEVTVVNFLGKVIFKNNYQNKSSINLPLKNLSRGIYLVKINIAHRGVKIMKIIKQ